MGKITVKDLESVNCTFVETFPGSNKFEKVKRKKVELKDGCSLRFGFIECMFKLLNDSHLKLLEEMKSNGIRQKDDINYRINGSIYEEPTQLYQHSMNFTDDDLNKSVSKKINKKHTNHEISDMKAVIDGNIFTFHLLQLISFFRSF
jgi:hypothetical protein